jgi:glycosyltransferase involved in cell wall biosynthesis
VTTKISACIVASNEGQLIDRCLGSIASKVDELLIVHDGPCSDDTLDIANKYSATVYVREHIGEAEPHRVFLYKTAKNDWIFQIDADEYASNELGAKLSSIPNDYSEYRAFEFYWPLWNGKGYFSTKGPYKLALFNRNFISFIGLPHENVKLLSGKKARLNYQVHHKPIVNKYTISNFRAKQLPWIQLNAKLLSQGFQLIEKYNYPAGSTWPRNLYLKRKYPYLTMLYLPIVNVVQSLRQCGSIYKREVLEYAFTRGLYALLLCFLSPESTLGASPP